MPQNTQLKKISNWTNFKYICGPVNTLLYTIVDSSKMSSLLGRENWHTSDKP